MTKSIFLDTALIIYYIEAHEDYGPIMKELISLFKTGKRRIYTSVITIAEVLPRPVSLKQKNLVKKFIEFLERGRNINLLDTTSKITEKAGRLRGKYSSSDFRQNHANYPLSSLGGFSVLRFAFSSK